MAIELFWMRGGPFAERCIMTLKVKGLSYQSRCLDPDRRENLTQEILAMSPTGTLPILRDAGFVVRESQAIMFYLDRAYPQMPLYGKTPQDSAEIMQEICEQQTYAEPVLRPLIAALLFGRPIPKDELDTALTGFDGLLRQIESRLGITGWLAAAQMTAADVNLYPLVHAVIEGFASDRAIVLDLTPPVRKGLSRLDAWLTRAGLFGEAGA